MEKLDKFGIKVNKKKTQILYDKNNTNTEILGIKVAKKINYLKMKISCERKTIKKDAE